MNTKQFLKIKSIIGEKIFSVSEFLNFLNDVLAPCRVVVQGEVGRGGTAQPGYSIFNLLDKDGDAVLSCFVPRYRLENLGLELKEGMKIKVFGYPKIYKPKGSLSFQVEKIALVGEGTLKKQFEALKKKLAKERIFDSAYKEPIPRFCERIGLITSKYGKGAKPDFEKHLGNYGFQIYFYDVRVEGAFAVDGIVNAIRWFNEKIPDTDCLVVIRGGGSWESLQAFNSEPVVRAIFASRIPVICGIGHESDVTLADLAADRRASTPTHAARIISDPWEICSVQIYKIKRSIISSVLKSFKIVGNKIDFWEKNLALNIKILIKNQKAKVEQSLKDLIKNQNWWKEKIEKSLLQQEEKLCLSSPRLKLKQGYTITSDEFDKIIKDVTKLKLDQVIKTKFYKGKVSSRVKDIKR